MYEVSKGRVRSEFSYARKLMSEIDKMMVTATDFTESGELGQAINELIASVSTALEWRESKLWSQVNEWK